MGSEPLLKEDAFVLAGVVEQCVDGDTAPVCQNDALGLDPLDGQGALSGVGARGLQKEAAVALRPDDVPQIIARPTRCDLPVLDSSGVEDSQDARRGHPRPLHEAVEEQLVDRAAPATSQVGAGDQSGVVDEGVHGLLEPSPRVLAFLPRPEARVVEESIPVVIARTESDTPKSGDLDELADERLASLGAGGLRCGSPPFQLYDNVCHL